MRESVIPVTKFVSPQAEIDIFEAMDVNPHTVGLQKVQGLEGEFGDAYKIEKNISRMELPSSYLEQMRFLLNNKRRMVIMANVKVMHNSRGTLFSLERRRKGMNCLTNINDKSSRFTLFLRNDILVLRRDQYVLVIQDVCRTSSGRHYHD